MEAKAVAKYMRISPRKMKYVCDMVRGKQVDEALAILKFHPGKGTAMGRDFTIFAKTKGKVVFGKKEGKKIIEVIPL